MKQSHLKAPTTKGVTDSQSAFGGEMVGKQFKEASFLSVDGSIRLLSCTKLACRELYSDELPMCIFCTT